MLGLQSLKAFFLACFHDKRTLAWLSRVLQKLNPAIRMQVEELVFDSQSKVDRASPKFAWTVNSEMMIEICQRFQRLKKIDFADARLHKYAYCLLTRLTATLRSLSIPYVENWHSLAPRIKELRLRELRVGGPAVSNLQTADDSKVRIYAINDTHFSPTAITVQIANFSNLRRLEVRIRKEDLLGFLRRPKPSPFTELAIEFRPGECSGFPEDEKVFRLVSPNRRVYPILTNVKSLSLADVDSQAIMLEIIGNAPALENLRIISEHWQLYGTWWQCFGDHPNLRRIEIQESGSFSLLADPTSNIGLLVQARQSMFPMVRPLEVIAPAGFVDKARDQCCSELKQLAISLKKNGTE